MGCRGIPSPASKEAELGFEPGSVSPQSLILIPLHSLHGESGYHHLGVRACILLGCGVWLTSVCRDAALGDLGCSWLRAEIVEPSGLALRLQLVALQPALCPGLDYLTSVCIISSSLEARIENSTSSVGTRRLNWWQYVGSSIALTAGGCSADVTTVILTVLWYSYLRQGQAAAQRSYLEERSRQSPGVGGLRRLWCQVGWRWAGVEAGVGHRVARRPVQAVMLLYHRKVRCPSPGAAGQGRGAPQGSLVAPTPSLSPGTLGSWAAGPHLLPQVRRLNLAHALLPVSGFHCTRPPGPKPQATSVRMGG